MAGPEINADPASVTVVPKEPIDYEKLSTSTNPEYLRQVITESLKSQEQAQGQSDRMTQEGVKAVDTLYGEVAADRKKFAAEHPAPGKLTYPEFDAQSYALGKHSLAAGAIFSVIAIAGAAKMRTGATGAMKALTGAMQGLQTGNEIAYKRGMDEYNNHLDTMILNQKEELQAYHDVQNEHNLSIQEKIDKFNMQQKIRHAGIQGEAKTIQEMNKRIAIASKTLVGLETTKQKSHGLTKAELERQEIDRLRKENPRKSEAEILTMYRDSTKHAPGSGKKKSIITTDGQKKTAKDFTPKEIQEAVDAVTREHPDWSPEKRAEEAKRKLGVA